MDSDDSDDWATEELPPLPTARETNTANISEQQHDDDESYWKVQPKPKIEEPPPSPEQPKDEGHPMLLVDMTELSKVTIHSKFDPNAVNDPVAVKSLRVTIEKDYQKYASDTALVANCTVIPCGSTVWRQALIQLRQEKPGHYFCPIFPPKK